MTYKIKPKKKLTCKKIDYYRKDEAKASKEYHKIGLHSLAKDEEKHKRFFDTLHKKCRKKKVEMGSVEWEKEYFAQLERWGRNPFL
jgi:rubrerythrin